MQQSWDKLDGIMRNYSPRLRDDLKLPPIASSQLATTIAAEVKSLPSDVLRGIRDDDPIGLQRRIDELVAFEHFMDISNQVRTMIGNVAPMTRAQVICQLYTVFVYLGESCFFRLRKAAPSGSVLKKCCKYFDTSR